MKISDAKQVYSAYLNTIQAQRQTLRKTLQEQEKDGAVDQNFDRVELSKELSRLDAQYEAVQGGMEQIMAQESMIHDAAAARQQGEAMSKAYGEMAKMLEVYRRIASGGKVPATDERKLMEYSSELYMAAKNMVLMVAREDREYDSLWKDEKADGENGPSAGEIAANTEIAAAPPEQLAALAAEAPAADAPV